MSKRNLLMALFVLLSAAFVSACGDDEECDANDLLSCGAGRLCKAGDDGAVCVPGCLRDNPATCDGAQACEEVEGSEQPLCFPAYELRGTVTNALDSTAIVGARIAARTAAGIVGGVASSSSDGAYSLKVPVKRKADGSPAQVGLTYSLRADAKDFQSFPGGLRPSLPIDVVAAATAVDGRNVVDLASTDIALLKLPEGARGTIRGRVDGDARNGTLVAAGGQSGVADPSGAFVIFNVPAAEQAVTGYTAGVQYAANPATVTVPAGGEVADVVLSPVADKPLASVSAHISNNANSAQTTVVLAVKQTFIETLGIGEVPRGLRVEGITTDFTIPNVPDGEYVILSSLENDGAVHKPSTPLVYVKVDNGVPTYTANGAVDTSPGWNIENAVAILSPGADAPAVVSGTPVFSWAKFGGNSTTYTIRLYDSFGDEVWSKTNVPNADPVTLAYDGDLALLKVGMTYQFRVWAIDNSGLATRSEDQRGVFTYAAQ